MAESKKPRLDGVRILFDQDNQFDSHKPILNDVTMRRFAAEIVARATERPKPPTMAEILQHFEDGTAAPLEGGKLIDPALQLNFLIGYLPDR